ncbi:MAG: ferrous iron transport protein B [Armatimonadota bacterium]|nr:MAG: ferrous iron transport protein B [Armatimonadota bacterium]
MCGHGCEGCRLVSPAESRRLTLFGSPNVGKSVIFNQLTGVYTVISNYPGTTVEVARGQARIGEMLLEVVDSPGAYSLTPFSEEERVARDLLLDEPADLVLHVMDAKNLRRSLPLTLQLIEAGVPVALDVNIIDEATRAGFRVDTETLSTDLGVRVVATAAASGVGMDKLRTLLTEEAPRPAHSLVDYPKPIESAISGITARLRGDYGFARRAVALLLLQREQGMWDRVRRTDAEAVGELEQIVRETEAKNNQPLAFPISVARQQAAARITNRVLRSESRRIRPSFSELLGRLTIHPLAGIPVLAAVLYFGLYLFVGRVGAGVVVDFLEQSVFESYVNPAATGFVERLLPSPTWSSLFVGEYGLITLGLRYALAIVLPLVGAFFLMFAVLEDSGYLPRLALLIDRLFKRIGLSGRAVIPIVLGFGCDTMATLVTRVLETRRERLIATFLLALAIPCSAQLGVILGLLSGHPVGLAIWGGVVLAVFFLSGLLAARLLPGEAARFYLEIPPIRWPSLRNVVTKTLARLRWYTAEVIPLFLLASVVIWIGEMTRLFQLALAALRPAVNLIGLPDSAAEAFLFGFFRRDYGAARIFDVANSPDAISGVPLVVAMVTITLFVPCVAQFLVMVRERGWRTGAGVAAVILPFALGVGFVLNLVLTNLGVQI